MTSCRRGFAIVALLVAGAGEAAARHKQVVSGYAVPKENTAGPVPADRIIHLNIGVEPRESAALAKLANDVSDPKSDQFQKFLTLEQVKARFSPTEADYKKVIDWAKASHLTVEGEFGNRLLLSVSGKASDVQNALAVTLSLARRADGSEFYKPDRAPSLDLDVKVSHVSGVDNLYLPRHHGGSLPNWNAYGAHDLRRAYASNCWGLHGVNESVGLTAFGGYNHADILAYQSFNTIPSSVSPGCGAGNASSGPCLNDVMVAGFNGTINTFSDEATMDVEMAVAMAPWMHQVTVFESNPATDACGDALVAAMASATGIKQFSTSNGVCYDPSIKSNLDMMAAMGETFFASSGDAGGANNLDNGTFYAVWAKKQIDVGGSVLTMNGLGISWSAEDAWKNSGGGVETYTMTPATCPMGCTPGNAGCSPWCIPPWQNNIGPNASTQFRNDPDVAMPALNVYCKLASGPTACCGTSISAPLWAGFMALINEQRCHNNAANCATGAGFIAPLLYDIGRSAVVSTSFHDIATNSSDATCPFPGQSLAAGTGYDHATGWGSPMCGLVAQFACTTCNGVTPSPGTPPSANCINFEADSNNCGSCGNICPGNLICTAGQCLPPGTVGDTHITTLDGLYYDFQASGDFLLIATSPAFVVQTRQVSGAPTWPNASINRAVAMRVGPDRIGFFRDPDRVVVEGKPAAIDDGKSLALPGGVTISRAGTLYTVSSLAGETVRVGMHPGYMNVIVGLGYSPGGAARGLLGNGNGRPDDDLLARDGKPLALPVSFADLYGVYGESVRVDAKDSLFGEEKGVESAPPARPFYASDLDNADYEKAHAACVAAGIKVDALLDACTLDVAVIGNPEAAGSFVAAPAPAVVMQPGQHPRRTGCKGCSSAGESGFLALAFATLLAALARGTRCPRARSSKS